LTFNLFKFQLRFLENTRSSITANDQLTQIANIDRILGETGQKMGISATQTNDGSGTVKFSVNFNSATFYSGFLKEQLGFIQKAFKPLDSVVELSTQPYPTSARPFPTVKPHTGLMLCGEG